MARPKRVNNPRVRFNDKLPCGTNGKPVISGRSAGRPKKKKASGRSVAKKISDRKADQKRKPGKASEKAARRAVFRFQGKSYGLTFSQAEGIPDKETLHAHLQTLLGVHNSIVALEYHIDGSQHFHCGGHVDTRIDIGDARYFDFVDPDGRVHHPNIVNGGPAWNNYCKKGAIFVSTFPARIDHMAHALTLPSVTQAMTYIMMNDAASYVRFGHTIEANLARHFRKLVAVRVPMWYGPYPELREPPNWDPMTHSLHLYGPPNSGKTVCAQHLLRCRYGSCEYIKGHLEALKQLSMTKPFVFDEVMLLTQPAATSREITDIVSGGTVHARYAPITIPPGLPRIFISNTRWVFKNPDESVYGRRLIQWEHLPVCALTESSQYVHQPHMEPEFLSMYQRWQTDHQFFADTGSFPRPIAGPVTPIGLLPPRTPIGLAPPRTPLCIQMFGEPAVPAAATPSYSPGWSPLLPYLISDPVNPDEDPLRPFDPSEDEASTLEL